MKISYVVAESPGNVALKTAEYDPQTLKPDEVLLKNEYSVISAGTERAWIIRAVQQSGTAFSFLSRIQRLGICRRGGKRGYESESRGPRSDYVGRAPFPYRQKGGYGFQNHG